MSSDLSIDSIPLGLGQKAQFRRSTGEMIADVRARLLQEAAADPDGPCGRAMAVVVDALSEQMVRFTRAGHAMRVQLAARDDSIHPARVVAGRVLSMGPVRRRRP